MKKIVEQNLNLGQKVNFHISKKFSFLGCFVWGTYYPGIKLKKFYYAAGSAAPPCTAYCAPPFLLASAASLRRAS